VRRADSQDASPGAPTEETPSEEGRLRFRAELGRPACRNRASRRGTIICIFRSEDAEGFGEDFVSAMQEALIRPLKLRRPYALTFLAQSLFVPFQFLDFTEWEKLAFKILLYIRGA
jgi:hypothetical protein